MGKVTFSNYLTIVLRAIQIDVYVCVWFTLSDGRARAKFYDGALFYDFFVVKKVPFLRSQGS